MATSRAGTGASAAVSTEIGEFASDVASGIRQRMPRLRHRGKDRKGRHTTTRRELFVAPSGALLIDTPGMRELQLWASDVADAFADIGALTARCRFTNCGHEHEPGCAVRAALASGELSEGRWLSYLKLRAEQAALSRHLAARPERTEKIVWRKVSKALRTQRHFEESQD